MTARRSAPVALATVLCLASGLLGWALGRAGAGRPARGAAAPEHVVRALHEAAPSGTGPARARGTGAGAGPPARGAPTAPTTDPSSERADAAPPAARARRDLAAHLVPGPGVALDQEQLAAAARLLVALGEGERACELLEPARFEDPDLAVELGDELLERGQRELATRVLLAGLRVDPCYDGPLELLSRIAPRRALETLERELAAMPAGVADDDEDLLRNRARLLQAVGRSREAVAGAHPLAELVREGSGCVPTGPQGAPWEWDAWEAVDPRGVEAILTRFLGEHSDHTREFGFRRLVALRLREGREGEARALCERFEEQGGSRREVAELLLEVAPAEGWRRLEELAYAWPARSDLAWRVGDHELATGRRDAALARWRELIAESWDDTEVAAETIARDRAALAPELDRRVAELERALAAAEEGEEWDALRGLGDAAEVAWRLGRRDEARRLLERVHERDPDKAYWYWMLRRMDAGIDPF